MKEKIENLKEQWLQVYSLSKEVIDESDYHDGLKNGWEWTESLAWQKIEQAKIQKKQASFLKFFLNEQFKFWEIHIDIWTEIFWQKARQAGIERNRKEPLQKVLERGRFAGGGEATHTSYEWKRLRQSGMLQPRYSTEQLDLVEKIIAEDAMKRLALLKKCLRLGRLTSSDYLRFGYAIAYFTRGGLFNEPLQDSLLAKHFSNEEMKTLDLIWDQYHISDIQRQNNLT